MQLPDIELVAAEVHRSWMEGKRAKGITSRKAEDGEELMVDYNLLSEAQKDMDRQLVRTVYCAISATTSEPFTICAEPQIVLSKGDPA